MDLFLLIPGVIAQMFIPTAQLSKLRGLLTEEAEGKIKTHQVIEGNISKR